MFQKYYGGQADKNDEASSIVHCKEGGMILCGRTTSYSSGLYDGLLMKLAEDGAPVWTRVIGGSDNDALIKVLQTADGGFVALGRSTFSTNGHEVAWVVKTNGAGDIEWSKKYNGGTNEVEVPKDIIQLKDGGFCLAVNLNEGTATGNALLMRLDTTGRIVWAKTLDNGTDDGVKSIAAYKDELLVAGYAHLSNRDAILTKLDMSNGSFKSASRYTNSPNLYEEASSVEVLENGISFAMTSYFLNESYTNTRLHLYRLADDGSVTFLRRADLGTSTGQKIEEVNCRSNSDKGFIYLANDVSDYGNSYCVKMGPYGSLEWGRDFFDYGYAGKISGMDITAGYGYVFAGYKNDYFNTGQKNKIQVFKTDRIGKTENCPMQLSLDFADTAINQINTFSWKTVQALAVQEAGGNMTVSAKNFEMINGCEGKVCDTAQATNENCVTNFLAEYKSDLRIETGDVCNLNDGTYAMAGNNIYYWNLEPMIIKTTQNGTVQWAKTFNTFIRDASFLKILPAAGNAMLVIGSESYTINHGVSDSALLMKIDYNGNVIWAKRYGRGSSTRFNDVQPTADGGCIMTVNLNYGSGSGQFTQIIRVDANGDFIWKKEIDALNLVVRNLLYDNAAVYVYGNAYINYNESAVVMILKLDAATGSYQWHKYFQSTKQQDLYPLLLEKIGDTLMAAVHAYTKLGIFETKRDAGFIKIRPSNGSVLSAHKITNIDHIPTEFAGAASPFVSTWVAKAGSDIVFAGKASKEADTAVYITRVASNGTLVWSRKYENMRKHGVLSLRNTNDGFAMVGSRWAPNLEWNVLGFYPFILKTDHKGVIAAASGGSQCFSSSYPAIVDTFSVLEFNGHQVTVTDLNENNGWGKFNYVEYKPYVNDIRKASTIFCSDISNCNKITINGADAICDFRKIYTYVAKKNDGCNAAVIWSVDTAFANIEAVSDSTISLKFKKAGIVNISASITSGCIGLTDVKKVNITRPANDLKLGPDIVLCAGNTYTLKAQTGFKSYLWSHNLGSDSVAVISKPGTYSLVVADFCNGVFSDTVVINAATFDFSAGRDTTKCNADSLVLTATPGYINYSWSPAYNLLRANSRAATAYPTVDTSYIVVAEKRAGCFVRDTVHVVVKTAIPVWLGNDTSICVGNTLMLNAGSGFISYSWNGELGTRQQEVSLAGTYNVRVASLNGCFSSDTIVVSALPIPNVILSKGIELCQGKSYLFTAGNFASYSWHNGSVDKTFTATGTGNVFVQVTDENGCKASDTTNVFIVHPLPAFFLPPDTAICRLGAVDIYPLRPFKSYLWNTGSKANSLNITTPGTYYLQVTDEFGCEGNDTLIVALKECLEGFYMPTAFSPNNDGLNDIFKPYIGGEVVEYKLEIYNRFGQLLFASNHAGKGWDGTVKSVPQPTGAYVFVCRLQLAGASSVSYKGSFTLIR